MRRFVDLEELVSLDVIEVLPNAAGPSDVDCIRDGVGAQAEVCTFVICGQIAAGSGDSYELRAVGRGELDLRADGVPIASMAGQVEREPMVSGRGLVAQNVRGSVVRGNHGIDAAIVAGCPR